MLALTDGGRMMGGPEAIEFFERLDDVLDEDIKDEEFCNDFTHALNRCRYSIARDIPQEPKYHKGRSGSKYDHYTCARCGFIIHTEDNYCPNCGQFQTWNYLGRRATKEEQLQAASPALRDAIEEVDARTREIGESGVPVADICTDGGGWYEAMEPKDYYTSREAAGKALAAERDHA